MESFETEAHLKEFDVQNESEEPIVLPQNIEHTDFLYDCKTQFRFLRKNISAFLRRKLKKDFKEILIVTAENPPIDYILAFKKQYPDKNIKVLIPLHDLENAEKTNISFEFYCQNKTYEARLYKLPKSANNIEIYGLFSASFSGHDISKLQYLAPFMKAVRICVKSLKPEVVHSDNLPFFLGTEFESKMAYPVKVLQVIDDFGKYEAEKTEAFWAVINLVNKAGMKKICRDKIIQKCMASLFNLHNTKHFSQMRDCLEFIYQNYEKFRSTIDRNEEIDENVLFRRMNIQVLKLFPDLRCEDSPYYNSIYFTLKKADFWAAISKSYYDDIFENKEICGCLAKRIEQTKSKSTYLLVGYKIPRIKLYQPFDVDNFRELRAKNKSHLLKEFSEKRVKTRFVDLSLFKDENYVIKGYLDSFFDAPLIFAKFSTDIFNEGVDIAFDVILKLFEQRKNVQVIINISQGLKNNFVKSWVEFLEQNSALDGRWLFINDEINIEQFYAAADIALFPTRANIPDKEHYKAMKFGCIPVASRSGILNDTVTDIFDDMISGCGFKTKTSLLTKANANEIYLETLSKALNLFINTNSSWNLLIKNAMNYDYSWNFEIIEKYNEIYEFI